MFKKTALLGATAFFTLGTTAAMAATSASAITDLNLRVGPGPAYQIAGVIPADGAVDVDGCVSDGEWCKVTYEGQTGWASGGYLLVDSTPVIETSTVSTIEYDASNETPGAAMIGTATGATIGALVGGPIGAVVGAVAGGAMTGEAAKIDDTTTTYVMSNPVEPVFLDGEVVTGARIPADTVTYYPIPSTDQYSYANINGNMVLVNPSDGTIVRVIR